MAQQPTAPQVNIEQSAVTEQLARMNTVLTLELAHTRAALDATLVELAELKRANRVAAATKVINTPDTQPPPSPVTTDSKVTS